MSGRLIFFNAGCARWFGCLFLLLAGSTSFAQIAAESVRIDEPTSKDLYLAGGNVDVAASVDADVIAAGGRVSVNQAVGGDLIAAGGVIDVRAEVHDDVRLAGGEIYLAGPVGDDAIMAGGSITLTPAAQIAGRAWLSGGRIEMAGTVGGELRAVAGEIVLSGTVLGDVLLTAQKVSIADGARIEGDLTYRSPEQADIASTASISGTVNYEPQRHSTGEFVAWAIGLALLVLISLTLTGWALFAVFPNAVESLVVTLRTQTWPCLGLGLAIFAVTPMLMGIAFFTAVGWLLGLALGAAYLLIALVGFLIGLFFVGDVGADLIGRRTASRSRWLWSFAAAALGVCLVSLIPLLGSLAFLLVLVLGMGAAGLGAYRGAWHQSAA